jgi:integrase
VNIANGRYQYWIFIAFSQGGALDRVRPVSHDSGRISVTVVTPRIDGYGVRNVARVIHRLGSEVTAVYPRGGVPADPSAAASIHMAKSHLRVVAPTEVKRTVAPKRSKNAELRTREHFTPDKVEALIEAARDNRYGYRDTTMILLTYRHGLRAAEVCDFRWDQVDFNGAVLHVRQVKNGTPSTHPIQGDELRALRRLHRESPSSPFVFVSERGSRSPRRASPG